MLPYLITLHPNILTIFISFAWVLGWFICIFIFIKPDDRIFLASSTRRRRAILSQKTPVCVFMSKRCDTELPSLLKLKAIKITAANQSKRDNALNLRRSNSWELFCTLPRNALSHKSTIMFTINTSCFSQDMLCLFQCPSRTRGTSDWDNRKFEKVKLTCSEVELRREHPAQCLQSIHVSHSHC